MLLFIAYVILLDNVDTLIHVVWITVSLGPPDGLKPLTSEEQTAQGLCSNPGALVLLPHL